MNATQKKFITKKLIPFILRAEGNGFVMQTWKVNLTPDFLREVNAGLAYLEFDGVKHKIPMCNTVACIGGSIQCLTGTRSKKVMAEKFLGITKEQANGLFYTWCVPQEDEEPETHGWPMKFRRAFEKRKTPLGKAKVAVALLKEVVRTNGQCLGLGD